MMDRASLGTQRRLFGLAVVFVGGCGLFGPNDTPPIKVETIASGERSGVFSDSTTVEIRRGTVVLESTVGYNQGGFSIDAVASDKAGDLTVDVNTKKADGIFLLEPLFVRHRFTVTALAAGRRRLRLVWHNVYYPDVLRVRNVLDTVITVR